MKASRRAGRAGVRVMAVSAGTMASSNGSATAAPIPRSTVRRGKAFFVMNHGCTLRIRNGLLSTTPRISDEKR